MVVMFRSPSLPWSRARLRPSPALAAARPERARSGPRLAVGVVTAFLALHGPPASGQCVLVQERGGPTYTPHLAIHFGDASEVPARLVNTAPLDKRAEALCLPLVAWNLWEGATRFELALETPFDPVGFDRAPEISGVTLRFDRTASGGTRTSLILDAAEPLCGPVRLGCLRLATALLPDAFDVPVVPHAETGRVAARGTTGAWRTLQVAHQGARIGATIASQEDPCPLNHAVRDLELRPTNRIGEFEATWTSGSGAYTLLRYRTDGRYPADPWDGEMLAFLPSSVTRFTADLQVPGDVLVTAWSLSRDSSGHLVTASDVECGSLGAVTLHLPIAVEQRPWQQVKMMYR